MSDKETKNLKELGANESEELKLDSTQTNLESSQVNNTQATNSNKRGAGFITSCVLISLALGILSFVAYVAMNDNTLIFGLFIFSIVYFGLLMIRVKYQTLYLSAIYLCAIILSVLFWENNNLSGGAGSAYGFLIAFAALPFFLLFFIGNLNYSKYSWIYSLLIFMAFAVIAKMFNL